MTKKLAAKIKELPKKPGVYLFKDKTGRILYAGKAVNLKNRVKSHFASKGVRYSEFKVPDTFTSPGWYAKVADVDFVKTENESQALILEDQLIKKYQPRYNVQRRDDKSYLWVSFSNDEWPRVQIVHKTKLKNPPQPSLKRGSKNGSPPLGGVRGDFVINPIDPFTNGKELKQIMRGLRKIFPYRTCKNPYNKPCLQWHLGLCPAHQNPPQPSLKGGGCICSPPLGGVRRDLKQQKNIYHNSLNTLRQLLRLYAGEPIRVEAYDISNIQGTNAAGSMIVFKGTKPDKSQYRKFKIRYENSHGRIRISRVPQDGTSERFSHAANDVAMLKEVLRRRLNHKEWPMPDMILIDGGRAQLNAIAPLTQSSASSAPLTQRGVGGFNISTISLAKKDEELYTIYSNRTLRLNALPIPFRLIFQAIRNEAHRFAISYYRHIHGKKFKRRISLQKTGN